MPFTNTPNMGMPLPTVSLEPGPQYATDVNQCISVLDSHDHGPGNGVPIGSQSINILSDLPFNIQNATSLRTARFVSTTATSGTDVGCVYVRGVDLFYNDLNANVVRITQSGGLSSTAVFIGNISTTAITSAAGPTPATSGFIRMNNNTDFLSWRNAGNSADNRLYFDSNNNLKVLGNVNGGVETYGVRLVDQFSGKVVSMVAANGTSAYTIIPPALPPSTTLALVMNPSGSITTSPFLATTSFMQPTIQKFVGGSGTYTTPIGAKYIRVRMVGGGGGGYGAGGAGTSGSITSLGAFMIANGGNVGGSGGGPGGSGGIGVISSPAIGFTLKGGNGSGGGAAVNSAGGTGGASAFGGNGQGGQPGGYQGGPGSPNTGGGGGGGAGTGSVSGRDGGGAGAYIEGIISDPVATYSYVVGTSGTGGAASGAQTAGGAGGVGFIYIEEFY